ncbi:MAG TPA: purine-nucleoside phosphorylase [Verrucomicrobiales bacterium]|nr:purine-nucleoside phosphorylase [Verrucomicrobiales bacterium]
MKGPGKEPTEFHNSSAITELATVAAASLRRKSRLRPAVAIVLGSGYEGVAAQCKRVLEIPYTEIPGYPTGSVAGHEGKLLLGFLAGSPVFVLSGRCHYYEGHAMETITFPMRMLAVYGIETVVLTNAAGGISKGLKAGTFMAIRDHINLMGANPLRGWSLEKPGRFVDLTNAYDAKLLTLLGRAAKQAKVTLNSGVYLAVPGPSYETPAEIAAFARLGADAIGMSTVPEVIVARQCGMRVAAISCITNPAAGRTKKAISHEEVLQVGAAAQAQAGKLLENFVKLHAQAG